MEIRQKVTVFLDDEEKEATIIDVLALDNKKYALFCFEGTSDLKDADFYAAEIVNIDGEEQLVDIESDEIREKLVKLVEQKVNEEEKM